MRKLKKIICSILIFILMVELIPVNSVEAKSNSTYTILDYGKLPKKLKGRKLTDKQIKSLDLTDVITLKKRLSTLEDDYKEVGI